MRNIINISKPTRQVNVRFPEVLWAKYKAASDGVGISLPSWLKMAAASYFRNWKGTDGKKPIPVRSSTKSIFDSSVSEPKPEMTPERKAAIAAHHAEIEAKQAKYDAMVAAFDEKVQQTEQEQERNEEKKRLQAEFDELTPKQKAMNAMKVSQEDQFNE